jgi:hypothetical protein
MALGPLIAHSCFAYESFYGDLLRLKAGSHHFQTSMLLMTGIFIITIMYPYIIGFQQALNTVIKDSNEDNSTWYGKLLEELGVPVKQVANK